MKSSSETEFAVYRGNDYLGKLTRRRVLSAMAENLGLSEIDS
jgi:hypothetical protein